MSLFARMRAFVRSCVRACVCVGHVCVCACECLCVRARVSICACSYVCACLTDGFTGFTQKRPCVSRWSYVQVGTLVSTMFLLAVPHARISIYIGTCLFGLFLSSTSPTIISLTEQYVDLTSKPPYFP